MKMLIAAGLIFGANTLQPPARFDHPFHGKVNILYLSPNDMLRVCHTYTACVRGPQPMKVCNIWINAGTRGNWTNQAYIRHEIAHCNGWPANHPD